MKITIGIPSPEQISPKFALESLPALISHAKQNIPNVDISILYQTGVRTDKNRNIIISKVLEAGDIDYILWLDADMYYPVDIISKYLAHEFDIIGCLYFKRSAPFNPVGYIKGTNPLKPFKQVDPLSLPKDTVVQVDGLGFGGVMVKTSVYKAMGDDKWMNYGVNYHLPYETEGQLTHDLEWCRNAQKYGFNIYMHTGVKPTHLAEYQISQADWQREHKEESKTPSVNIILPTIHPEIAIKTAKILSSRANFPHKMFVVEDKDRSGFVATCNMVVRENPADYYVFLTDDIFPSRNWLKEAMRVAIEKKAGLVGFNDGKWNGVLATCGLVEHNWMIKNYNGNMFYPEYFGHFNDTEITMLAINDKTYAYNPNISLIEVDYEKETKGVHVKDREIFNRRKLTKFDGRITDERILNNYA